MSFGQILTDVNKGTTFHAGDTVYAVFVGANPRVSLLTIHRERGVLMYLL